MTDPELDACIAQMAVICRTCAGYGEIYLSVQDFEGGGPTIIHRQPCDSCASRGRVLPEPVQVLVDEVRRLQAELAQQSK